MLRAVLNHMPEEKKKALCFSYVSMCNNSDKLQKLITAMLQIDDLEGFKDLFAQYEKAINSRDYVYILSKLTIALRYNAKKITTYIVQNVLEKCPPPRSCHPFSGIILEILRSRNLFSDYESHLIILAKAEIFDNFMRLGTLPEKHNINCYLGPFGSVKSSVLSSMYDYSPYDGYPTGLAKDKVSELLENIYKKAEDEIKTEWNAYCEYRDNLVAKTPCDNNTSLSEYLTAATKNAVPPEFEQMALLDKDLIVLQKMALLNKDLTISPDESKEKRTTAKPPAR